MRVSGVLLRGEGDATRAIFVVLWIWRPLVVLLKCYKVGNWKQELQMRCCMRLAVLFVLDE